MKIIFKTKCPILFLFPKIRLSSDKDKADSEIMAVRTAEKLLKEVKPKPGDLRPFVLENMALIATKQKQNIEKAINNFMEICSSEASEVSTSAVIIMYFIYIAHK